MAGGSLYNDVASKITETKAPLFEFRDLGMNHTKFSDTTKWPFSVHSWDGRFIRLFC